MTDAQYKGRTCHVIMVIGVKFPTHVSPNKVNDIEVDIPGR